MVVSEQAGSWGHEPLVIFILAWTMACLPAEPVVSPAIWLQAGFRTFSSQLNGDVLPEWLF